MTVTPNPAGPARASSERRAQERIGAYGFPLSAPAEAHLVDCGTRGVGLETGEQVPVGSLIQVKVYLPRGDLAVIGRVCWARLVANRPAGDGESRPVYRAGVSLLEGQPFRAWESLLLALVAPRGRTLPARPRRRVVKWRPARRSS